MTKRDFQPPKTMIEETDIQTPTDSLSPHEGTWTQDEQEAMAREIIRLGDAIKLAEPLLREIRKHPARNGPIQVAAGKLMVALGISQNASDHIREE
jgi:hypothetical protein